MFARAVAEGIGPGDKLPRLPFFLVLIEDMVFDLRRRGREK